MNAEENIIHQLENKSRSKPLLVFHDESNIINACDVISDMALYGKIIILLCVFRYKIFTKTLVIKTPNQNN